MKPKSSNVKQEDHYVSVYERSEKNGHVPALLFFEGESKAEKSDLLFQLEKQLFNAGFQVGVINNDRVSQGLSENLGLSDQELRENLRRAKEMAFLMLEAGWLVLADFQSCSACLSDTLSIQKQVNLTSIQITIKNCSKIQKNIEIKKKGIVSSVILKREELHRSITIDKLVTFISQILKKGCHP